MTKDLSLVSANDSGTTIHIVPIDDIAIPKPAPVHDTGVVYDVPATIQKNDIATVTNGTGSYVVNGTITDKTGNLLLNATIQIVAVSNNKPLTDPFTVDNGKYVAWTDQNTDIVAVVFTLAGYATRKIVFTDLINKPDVVLTPGNSFPWLEIALVLGAVYAINQAKRKRGEKIGKISAGDVTVIFFILGGVIAFSVIKKILESLGLWNSKDTKDLDNAATNPSSFWNPNYWQTIKPANANWSYAFTESDAQVMAAKIWNAFNWYNDDEDAVMAIFRQCRTKANASFLAWVFQNKFGQDLLTFLRGGNWPQDRLSDADVNTINQFISKLPNY